jgi:Zn-dependent protease with chaperone function
MKRSIIARIAIPVLITMMLAPLAAISQTQVKAPKNPYSADKDVQLGQQAAGEVEQKLPMIRNPREIEQYVNEIGTRLAEGIPAEFRNPAFRYQLKVVDAKEINAFALPGGFSYVNRGLIEAAQNEGELAGVIAHEFSHVALRHGTAQVAKANKYSWLGALGQVGGAVLGGAAGGVLAQGSQMGLGAYLLKFSREYEQQADILGSHIMANAGYDPRDLANMFRTIEKQSGGSGPQWLSSHPNPGNRYEYINREADLLKVSNPTKNTPEFTRVRALLRDGAYGGGSGSGSVGGRGERPGGGRIRERVAYPSSQLRTYSGDGFQLSVPENWREIPNAESVTFAPRGAYEDVQGRVVFTHGMMVGAVAPQSRNLRQATEQFINTLSQGNPDLRAQGTYQRGYVGGQEGLGLTLRNVSEATGQPETVVIYTTLRNGRLFYMIGVAPQNEYTNYQRAFQSVLSSMRWY